MMKKILCMLFVLVLFAVLPAAAEEAVQPLAAGELATLLESARAGALQATPLNDPVAEDARTEDGNSFEYPGVWIFADATALDADTPVNALVFGEGGEEVLRGTGVNTQLEDLLAAFPLENPELAGTREEALLYLRENDKGYAYGRLIRDGQRVSTVEYVDLLPEGDHYRRAAATYTLLNGRTTFLRVDGLNPAGADLPDANQAAEILAEMKALAGHDEYRAVKASAVGTELEPFGEQDLFFDGFSYTAMQPATMPDNPEQELIDNGDGTWLLRMDGDGWEAVFSCGRDGENAQILSFSLLDDETEGPRAVRLGDLFFEDFMRFRSGEGELDDNMTETLYGTEGTAPWGLACYNPDDMTLRYVTDTAAGIRVELLLKYEKNELTEIILHTLD